MAAAPEPVGPKAKTPAEPDAAQPTNPELPIGSPASDPTSLTPEELAQRQLQAKIEQATEHFKEGKRLYGNGLYVEAAIEFERSYASVAAANTLYATSLAYGRAGKTVEAVRALQRYLALPDCSQRAPEQRTIDCTDQRTEAKEALAEQRRRVGELVLKIAEGVDLREVRVAGRTVPVDDFPLLLLPGTVDVELFGMGPEDRRTRPANITAGEVYEVYVAPFEADAVPLPPNVKGGGGGDTGRDRLREQQRQRRLKIAFWTGAGLTAGSGIALGVIEGLKRYHSRRFDIEKCEVDCFEKDEMGNWVLDNGEPIPRVTGYPLDHKRLVERYEPISNALIGVTIGLAVGTALLGVFAFRKRGAERPLRQARVHVHLGAPGLVVRW